MDRRGFLGIMVFAAAGWLVGRSLVRNLRNAEYPREGLKEAMYYRKA